MKNPIRYVIGIIAITTVTVLASPNYQFPVQLDYPGCIKPNDITQTSMDNSVTGLFDFYKGTYLTEAKNTSGGYYTDASGNGSGGKSASTISEAHGYGMIIFALMAGYDSDAQTIFDGYFKFYQDHPSMINPLCMSWTVDADESSNAQDGASDGDMDIAYSLLLAHYQWGSNGSINYLNEAINIINNGIKVSDMHQSTYRVSLGDWTQDGGDVNSTRSSDWMPDHMRAYEAATGDNFWRSASSKVYELISSLTENYASTTGLMPDFVKSETPAPDAKAGGTGEKNGADYSYNACRFPWRIATDYAHYGTADAKTALDNISSWLRTGTGGDIDDIYAGYELDGTKLVNYNELTFTAPFTAGLISNADNQEFLNSCWGAIKNERGSNEYDCALNLLSMLLVSGNWWAPAPSVYTNPSNLTLSNEQVGEGMGAQTLIGTIATDDGIAPYAYSLLQGQSDFEIRNDSLFSLRQYSATDDNPLNCQIRSTDGKGTVINKTFSIEVTDASLNMVQHLWWWVDIDTYGSSVDTGAALINETSIAATFTMGTSNEEQDEWVYGIMSCDSLTKDLGDSRFITIEYRSDNAFALTLQMGAVLDDAFHAAILPVTNGEWQSVTFNIDGSTFKQPSDWGDPVAFDPSDIQQFTFSTMFESESGMIDIRTVQIDEFSVDDIPVAVEAASPSLRSSIAIAGVRNQALSLSVPSAGKYTVSLYTVQGRLVQQVSQELTAGIANIPLSANLGTSALILRVEHAGASFTGKICTF
jgi:endoglucanase